MSPLPASEGLLDKLKGIEIDADDRRTIRRALLFIGMVVGVCLGWAVKAGNAEVIKSIASDGTWAGVALLFVLIAGIAVKRIKAPKPPAAEPSPPSLGDTRS